MVQLRDDWIGYFGGQPRTAAHHTRSRAVGRVPAHGLCHGTTCDSVSKTWVSDGHAEPERGCGSTTSQQQGQRRRPRTRPMRSAPPDYTGKFHIHQAAFAWAERRAVNINHPRTRAVARFGPAAMAPNTASAAQPTLERRLGSTSRLSTLMAAPTTASVPTAHKSRPDSQAAESPTGQLFARGVRVDLLRPAVSTHRDKSGCRGCYYCWRRKRDLWPCPTSAASPPTNRARSDPATGTLSARR